jgi:hypothetical protein
VNAIDHWSDLTQGGRLLDRKALEQLPEPRALGSVFADRLRDALTQLPADRSASGEVLSALLDFVLEDTCGLATGWAKGPGVSAEHSERLIDGTELKPRRILKREGQNVLAVFTTAADRIGLHQGRRPLARAIEYLRRRKITLGLVTNGREWRLVFADPDNLAWVQWSAERWLEGDKLHPTLELFRRVISADTLTPGKDGAAPTLIESIRTTRRGQATLSAELGERVRAAVELLLRSRRSVLDPVWSSQDPKSVYVAACHFVMRLVVVLFAEARELLPVDNPIYHHAYGIRGLIEALERAGVDRRKARTSAWPRLLGLFKLIHGGSLHPQLLVTAYGGDLFRAGDAGGDAVQKALSVLESSAEPPTDDVIYDIVTLLTRTTERVREGAGWRKVAAPVDFTELTSEYIGILYEGLLDYELRRAGDEPVVFLGLGEQPALPLDRLEQMDEKQLRSLVDKAKLKKKAGEEEEDEAEEDTEEEAENGDEEAEPADEVSAIEALLPGDDQRLKAWERAVKWAARAATAGKLIKAPKNKAATQDAAWKAQLDATAKALIVGLKLPGEFYLVRWGGTRKGAGTFYTRPQLTLPTVRRTLEPLLRDSEGRVRKPEDLLALKICDPAMGSGSFLVAAIRVLTEKVIEALHVHRRIDVVGDHVRISCELLPDADRDQPEDRVQAIVRRAVVEYCIYGVDVDPLAVELARVALWVETLDRRLPFTFLDHKLRCGNALVGAWLDRFRDYPLLAWWRQSPDEKWRGVAHAQGEWAESLKDHRATVVQEQADLLAGQRSLLAGSVTDDELKAAIDRVRAMYGRLRRIPASQPDKRAELWRTQVAPDPALARVREALDAWCAVWFWPLDRLDDAPRPANLLAPTQAAKQTTARLRDEIRFFHWELEFPDVFTGAGTGFDAILANPPWETIQAHSLEFFSSVDPLYRSYGKQDALRRQRELFEAQPDVETAWLQRLSRVRELTNFARFAGEPHGDGKDPQQTRVGLVPRRPKESDRLHQKWAAKRRAHVGLADPAHPYQRQGEGKPYSYRLFAEQAYALLQRGGQLGVLVPSGFYMDAGSVELRRLLLEASEWRWLYGFENRQGIFDIHRAFKFAVVIAAKGGSPSTVAAAFMRHDVDDWSEARGAVAYPVDRIRAFSPKTLSVLEVRSDLDIEISEVMRAQAVMVGDDRAEGWQVRYKREFNSTDDSAAMPSVETWLEKGFVATEFLDYRGPNDEVALPVLSGRVIDQHNFAAASWVTGKGRSSEWKPTSASKKDFRPEFLMASQYYVQSDKRFGYPKMAFMEVASATNERTCIGALTPDWPGIHKTPFLWSRGGDYGWTAALSAVFNSFAFDYAARLSVGGLSLGWFLLEVLPLPAATPSLRELGRYALRLGAAHPVMAPYWVRCYGPDERKVPWKQLWAITPSERTRVRAIIDAAVAFSYGLEPNHYRWILRDCDRSSADLSDKRTTRTLDPKGFWRVDKQRPPELRASLLSLVALTDLNALWKKHGGSRDDAIRSFLRLNDGDGWELPREVRLADHGCGDDARSQVVAPVAQALGDRYEQWQLSDSVVESWADCERLARSVLGAAGLRSVAEPGRARAAGAKVLRSGSSPEPTEKKPSVHQRKLFE